MDPQALRLILNTLRCPICKAQIDLYDYMGKKSKSTRYNFCCAADYYHYRMWFPHWDGPKIEYDMVELYEGKFRYRIDQRYKISRTRVDIDEVDPEHNIKDETKTKTFQYDQILFDYPTTNRVKVVNRLKTILTFQ